MYMRAKDLMNRKAAILIFLLTTALILLTIRNPPFTKTYFNASAVTTTGSFGIYWDKNCTRQATSIAWGTLTPGSAGNATVYVRNENNATCYLAVATSNWNPPNAPTYLRYSWTSTTSKIDAGKTLEVKQTLKVTPDITGITTFSFNITFQQLNSYRWDVNQDHTVDIKDLYIVAKAYGATPQTARWNPSADVNGDSMIDVKDTYIVVKHFGETYT